MEEIPMDKKILFVILFAMLLILPSVSALELNPFADSKNFKPIPTEDMSNFLKEDFNAKYGVIELRSNFMWVDTGKVAEYSLTKNTELCMINCEAEGKVTLYSDGTLFDDVKFINLGGEDTTIRSSEYLLFDGYQDNYIDAPATYKEVCEDLAINGTSAGGKSCHQIPLTYVKENHPIEVWNKYDGSTLKAGDYRWKIKGTKNQEQSVDFIPIKSSKEFSEWATWTASFNTGLRYYWGFNEASGTTSVDNVSANNMTLSNAGLVATTGCKNGNCIIESGSTTYTATAGSSLTTGGNTDQATISFWYETLDTGNYKATMGVGTNNGQPFANGEFQILTGGTGDKIGMRVGSSNGEEAMPLTNDGWHHYAWVFSNGIVLKMYKDGVNVANTSNAVTFNNFASGKSFVVFNTVAGYSSPQDQGVDELAIWNRTLSQSEITDLATGIYYINSFGTPLSITTTLISPVNAFNSSSSSVTFSANATAVNGNVTNMTLYVWNGGTRTNVTTGLTGVFNSSSWIMAGLTSADYTWNVYSCGTNATGSACAFNTNRTLTVDTTIPTFVVRSPTANSSTLTSQTNITLNVTSSDAHLSSCWYNTNQNATNISYTCNALTNVSFTGGLQYIINAFANDTFGNQNSTSTSYFLNYIVPAMTITTPIAEGESHTIYFNVNASSIYQTNATVNYNGTAYPMTLISNDGTHAYFSKTLIAPLVTANTNISVNVDYFVNGVSGSTASQNQTVIDFAITDCALVGGRVIMNMSLKDEELNTLVNITTPNTAVIEIDMDVTSLFNSSNVWSFSKKWESNNTVAVCVPNGLLNDTSYRIDFTAGYEATGKVKEFYYMDNGTLDNTVNFNSYTDNTIDLMDLASADSTTFLFTFTDADGLEVDEAIVHTFRDYIGEGIFREVERSKQDNNGETHVHLVEEDVIYYFMVTQYGNIIYTSDTYNAKCLSTPCAISLSASPTETNWSIIDNEGGRYSITSDQSTRIATLDFSLDSSALVNFSLYSYEGSTATLINQTSLTAMSGSIDLLVPLAYGNKTFFAVVYNNNVFVKSQWIDLTDRGQDYFGTFGGILAGLIVLAMMLMAVTEGAGFIIFTVLALIVVTVMKLVDLNWMALISIICAGAIIMWKLVNRRNKIN